MQLESSSHSLAPARAWPLQRGAGCGRRGGETGGVARLSRRTGRARAVNALSSDGGRQPTRRQRSPSVCQIWAVTTYRHSWSHPRPPPRHTVWAPRGPCDWVGELGESRVRTSGPAREIKARGREESGRKGGGRLFRLRHRFVFERVYRYSGLRRTHVAPDRSSLPPPLSSSPVLIPLPPLPFPVPSSDLRSSPPDSPPLSIRRLVRSTGPRSRTSPSPTLPRRSLHPIPFRHPRPIGLLGPAFHLAQDDAHQLRRRSTWPSAVAAATRPPARHAQYGA